MIIHVSFFLIFSPFLSSPAQVKCTKAVWQWADPKHSGGSNNIGDSCTTGEYHTTELRDCAADKCKRMLI